MVLAENKENKMEYEIYDRYQDLGSPEERSEWLDEYEGAINRGRSHEEAEVIASNCAQRAGYNVNKTGGLSIREISA